MSAIGEREALEACRTLFGEPADAAFLDALVLPSVKRAFRQKALLLHPDRFAGAARAIQQRQTERFQAISGAYETLLAWLDQGTKNGARAAGTPDRPPAPPRPAPPASGPPPRRPTARPRPPPVEPTARPHPPPVEPTARPHPPPVEPAAPRASNAAAGPGARRTPDPAPAASVPHSAGPAPGAPPAGREGLGSYLHRHGLISRHTLLCALVWQRRGRLKVGELAVRWGWLTPAEVQQVLASRGPSPRFAERAVDLGLLSPFRARALLRFQGSRQRRLGDYFVEHGVLGRELVERLAALHRADADAREGANVAAPPPRRAASRA